MRGLCSAILAFEALVIGFAALVAKDLTEVSDGALWAVAGGGAAAALVLTGLLGHRWAYVAGSVFQLLLVASGLVVPVMFFLGVVFAALWFGALWLGRRVARLQAAAGSQAAADQ
jgi:hypothetical protein